MSSSQAIPWPAQAFAGLKPSWFCQRMFARGGSKRDYLELRAKGGNGVHLSHDGRLIIRQSCSDLGRCLGGHVSCTPGRTEGSVG